MTEPLLPVSFYGLIAGEEVVIKRLDGHYERFEVTKTFEPGHWGVDPYLPSNIIRGEN